MQAPKAKKSKGMRNPTPSIRGSSQNLKKSPRSARRGENIKVTRNSPRTSQDVKTIPRLPRIHEATLDLEDNIKRDPSKSSIFSFIHDSFFTSMKKGCTSVASRMKILVSKRSTTAAGDYTGGSKEIPAVRLDPMPGTSLETEAERMRRARSCDYIETKTDATFTVTRRKKVTTKDEVGKLSKSESEPLKKSATPQKTSLKGRVYMVFHLSVKKKQDGQPSWEVSTTNIKSVIKDSPSCKNQPSVRFEEGQVKRSRSSSKEWVLIPKSTISLGNALGAAPSKAAVSRVWTGPKKCGKYCPNKQCPKMIGTPAELAAMANTDSLSKSRSRIASRGDLMSSMREASRAGFMGASRTGWRSEKGKKGGGVASLKEIPSEIEQLASMKRLFRSHVRPSTIFYDDVVIPPMKLKEASSSKNDRNSSDEHLVSPALKDLGSDDWSFDTDSGEQHTKKAVQVTPGMKLRDQPQVDYKSHLDFLRSKQGNRYTLFLPGMPVPGYVSEPDTEVEPDTETSDSPNEDQWEMREGVQLRTKSSVKHHTLKAQESMRVVKPESSLFNRNESRPAISFQSSSLHRHHISLPEPEPSKPVVTVDSKPLRKQVSVQPEKSESAPSMAATESESKRPPAAHIQITEPESKSVLSTRSETNSKPVLLAKSSELKAKQSRMLVLAPEPPVLSKLSDSESEPEPQPKREPEPSTQQLAEVIQREEGSFDIIVTLLRKIYKEISSAPIHGNSSGESLEEVELLTGDNLGEHFHTTVYAIRRRVKNSGRVVMPPPSSQSKDLLTINSDKLRMHVKTDDDSNLLAGKVGNLEITIDEKTPGKPKMNVSQKSNTDPCACHCCLEKWDGNYDAYSQTDKSYLSDFPVASASSKTLKKKASAASPAPPVKRCVAVDVYKKLEAVEGILDDDPRKYIVKIHYDPKDCGNGGEKASGAAAIIHKVSKQSGPESDSKKTKGKNNAKEASVAADLHSRRSHIQPSAPPMELSSEYPVAHVTHRPTAPPMEYATASGMDDSSADLSRGNFSETEVQCFSHCPRYDKENTPPSADKATNFPKSKKRKCKCAPQPSVKCLMKKCSGDFAGRSSSAVGSSESVSTTQKVYPILNAPKARKARASTSKACKAVQVRGKVNWKTQFPPLETVDEATETAEEGMDVRVPRRRRGPRGPVQFCFGV